MCGTECLHRFARFDSPHAVCIGLDHSHDARAGWQQAAVVVVVVGHCVKVDFECGFVSGAFESSRHFIEERVVFAKKQNLRVVKFLARMNVAEQGGSDALDT